MRKSWIILIIMILLTIAAESWIGQSELRLVRETGVGTVALQFAFTPARGEAMVLRWKSGLYPIAKQALWRDFLLIFSYVVLLVTLSRMLKDGLMERLSLGAAVADCFENMFHLIFLYRGVKIGVFYGSLFALLKWGMLLFVIILLVRRGILVIGKRRAYHE